MTRTEARQMALILIKEGNYAVVICENAVDGSIYLKWLNRCNRRRVACSVTDLTWVER